MPSLPILEDYLAGPETLREAVDGISEDQFDAVPVPGKWSTRQVVCHIADCEVVYADRMKRVIAENNPLLLNLDPEVFAARLAYERRDVETEIQVVESVRTHMARILQSLEPEDFRRTGQHSTDGPLTLETLLARITRHIPHHVRFILEKKEALKSGGEAEEVLE